MVRVPGSRTAAVAVVGACALAALAAGASARSLIGKHGAASGTVVFANTSSVQKLDPHVVTNFLDFQALHLIYDTLVSYNGKLQLTEHLPSSITVQKVLDLSYRALMLQDRTGPLANLYNRLAMACALNRQAVLTSSVLGQGKVVGPVPVGPYASNPISAVCPT